MFHCVRLCRSFSFYSFRHSIKVSLNVGTLVGLYFRINYLRHTLEGPRGVTEFSFSRGKGSKMAASRVLVYGGKGALGATCVSYFKAKDWVSKKCSATVVVTLKLCEITQLEYVIPVLKCDQLLRCWSC